MIKQNTFKHILKSTQTELLTLGISGLKWTFNQSCAVAILGQWKRQLKGHCDSDRTFGNSMSKNTWYTFKPSEKKWDQVWQAIKIERKKLIYEF